MRRILMLSALVSLALLPAASGDEIQVSPGPGALAAGLAKAKPGDVVKVAAGDYPESVALAEGVTLEGAGASKTILTAPGYAALNCTGPRVRIVGLTIRGGEKNVRGVNSSAPVRVERCRFEKIKEGVALMGAPLSDILACEFDGCGIAVRAIGGASPTVWGCVFKGGDTGIFGMNGSLYARNNLFDGPKIGVRILPDSTQPGVFRNNIFLDCKTAAIEIMPGERALFGPSIRNSIVLRCGAALVSDAELAKNTSHAIVHDVTAPAFRDKAGKETRGLGEASLSDAALAVSVDKDFNVTADHPELLKDRGVRLCSEKEDAKGTLGLEGPWARVGVGASAELPPSRFAGPRLIANCVHEEYQYLKLLDRGMSSQGMSQDHGVPVDRLTLSGSREPKELVFDISRFFGEESIGE